MKRDYTFRYATSVKKSKKRSSKSAVKSPLKKKKVRKVISVKSQYSGHGSRDFWEIVNSIKNEADHQELYSLGVALQNMEDYVLKRLKNIKNSYVRGKL